MKVEKRSRQLKKPGEIEICKIRLREERPHFDFKFKFYVKF
jgi:hypothetical protein